MGFINSILNSFARHTPPRKMHVNARFDAAQTTADNRAHWLNADLLSPDAEGSPEVRSKLRRRSRYEILNNSYAEGLVEMLQNDTIGTGPRLQMLLKDEKLADRIEKSFAKWAEAIKLTEKLQLMKRSRVQDGETFCLVTSNPGLENSVKLDLQVIEADLVCNASGEPDTSNFIDGIRYDQFNNPVSYQVLKNFPGDTADDKYNIIDARYILHTFKHKRAGQHRGIPELTSSLPLFAQLRRYNLACLSAAEAAADFSAILYTDAPPDGEAEEIEPMDKIPLERNMMLSVPAGWKLGQLESKHPTSNHSEFVKSILSEIARCVCCTYGAVSGDYSGYNYASGRLDAQLYQRSVIVDRNKWQIDILNPILRKWLREWCLVNAVSLPDEDYNNLWFWDGFLHVDPTKEASAQKVTLESNLSSLSEEYAKRGKDWKVEIEQISREKKYMKKLGIEAEPKKEATGAAHEPAKSSKP